MSIITERVSRYVIEKGINLSNLAKETGHSYNAISHSIGAKNTGRELRDDEFMDICRFLEVNPLRFATDEGQLSEN